MIGILGGMGTQAGLDICNKIAILHRGKQDQQYPKFLLYNKSDTPKRPENLKKYYNVLKELVKGCKLLEKNSNIQNKNMHCKIIKNKPKYYYKIKDGITNVKGGICVLKELNYPNQIIKNTKKIISEI